MLSDYRCANRVLALLVAMMLFTVDASAEVFHYVDDNGRKIFVDNPQKIPAKFRAQRKTFREEGEKLSAQQKQALKQQRQSAQYTLTAQRRLRKLEAKRAKMQIPVTIRGNQVIVPVKLVWRGRVANVRLLLDTGASMTVLHKDAVASLNPTSRNTSYAQVAGGGIIKTEDVIFDRLELGPYKLENKLTAVIENQRAAGFDGLLGMDILGRARYEIDFEGRQIIWDPQAYKQLGEMIQAFKEAESKAESESVSDFKPETPVAGSVESTPERPLVRLIRRAKQPN